MDPIPKRETGYATALYSVMRNIGSSVGVSFVTTWLARRAQFNQTVLAAHVTPYDSATQRMLSQAQAMLMRNGADPVTANRQAMAMIYGEVRQQASVLSFLTVFRTIGIVFLVIIPLVLFLRKPKHLRELDNNGKPAPNE
jgi:DHA2 family multidrug resistance protein